MRAIKDFAWKTDGIDANGAAVIENYKEGDRLPADFNNQELAIALGVAVEDEDGSKLKPDPVKTKSDPVKK
jgi:hypothetical protein